MWLEFQIDYREIGSVIFFELKVPKDTTIHSLRVFILNILNSILIKQHSTVRYDIQHIALHRLKMTEEVIISTDLRSSIIDQSSKIKKMKETFDEDIVKDMFSYINRYVLCTPPNKLYSQNSKQRRSIVRETFEPIIVEVLENLQGEFQIRNPRNEAKIFTKINKQLAMNSKRKSPSDARDANVCTCIIG